MKFRNVLLIVTFSAFSVFADDPSVWQNRFTTNREPIANGTINGAPLTNILMSGVSNLNSTLTGITNYADNTKLPITNGTAQTSLKVNGNLTVSTNLVVTNTATVLGEASFGSAVGFDGPTTFTADAGFADSANVNFAGGIVTITGATGDMHIGGELSVTAASTFDQAPTLTGFSKKALTTDNSGGIVESTTTDTELAYLTGVTSSVQTQFSGKLDKTNGIAFTHLGLSGGNFDLTNSTDAKIVLTESGSGNQMTLSGRNNALRISGPAGTLLEVYTNQNAKVFGSLTNATDVFIGRTATVNSNLFVGGSITATNLGISSLLVSDGNKRITNSSVTATEAGYLSGVTSAIQAQLNNKVDESFGTASDLTSTDTTLAGTTKMDSFSGDHVVISDSATTPPALAESSITTTELATLSGATGNLNSRINSKLDNTSGIFTNSLIGKGNLSVQSNLFANTLMVTNTFTEIGNIVLAGSLFTSQTNNANYSRVTNDLMVGGVIRSTNALLNSPTATNLTAIGTNYVKGSISFQSTNILTAAAGNNEIETGTNTLIYISNSGGSPTADFNLSGLTQGRADRVVWVCNATTNLMTVVNESGAVATAANRIRINSDTAILTNGWVLAIYDNNISRWRIQPLPVSVSGVATNLTPWTSDINGAGYSLTNAGYIQIRAGGTGPILSLNDSDNGNTANFNYDSDPQLVTLDRDFYISGNLTVNTNLTVDTIMGATYINSVTIEASSINATSLSGDASSIQINNSSFLTVTNSPGFNAWQDNSSSGGYQDARAHVTVAVKIDCATSAGAGIVAIVEDSVNGFTNRFPWGVPGLTGLAPSYTNSISFQVNNGARWMIQTNGAAGSAFTILTDGTSIQNE